MIAKPQFAPGPYQTQDVGCQTSFHTYVVDANGRKIGVAWGPVAEKVWTQALFAGSFELLAAAKAACETGNRHKLPALQAAIDKIEGDATITSTNSTGE